MLKLKSLLQIAPTRLVAGQEPARGQFPRFPSPWTPLQRHDAYRALHSSQSTRKEGPSQSAATSPPKSSSGTSQSGLKTQADWDDNPNLSISAFSELPHTGFGVNQHMLINEDFKEALRQILWQFRAPIRYAFAYGSGVFAQGATGSKSATSIHPNPNPAIVNAQGGQGKMIDMIFGVSHTQHWHSLNLHQHRDHYSAIGSLGSALVSNVQDRWGAGVYFNPYVTVNGTLIKYGVVHLDTLCKDLSEWDTLYLAGRLQKPVKILRDDARVRLANQINLISALRTALLFLPSKFDEHQLYAAIAGISYMGDPRMSLPTENPQKVSNIVSNQITNFRRLYAPLVENLPNISFNDASCSNPRWDEDPGINASLAQDMDPVKRGNMVRRLPKAFKQKLYFQFQGRFQIPQLEFNKMMEESSDNDPDRIHKRQGGTFERRVAGDEEGLNKEIPNVIRKTIGWPSTQQSLKGIFTAGLGRSWRYTREKIQKWRDGRSEGTRAKTGNGQKDKIDGAIEGAQKKA
ncbi:MAG: hypothetical protein M1825_002519 [Sarcosagium campestre]|nr:MAG: hypothetical protein M1825_002519 [Sarcosagium campestre]